MAWSIDERFPAWGESGEFPVVGFFYEGGDQVNEKHLDALWNGVNGLEEDTQAALSDIDSDADGVVDEADYANDADASTYKGNDIDTDGNGLVDLSEDSNQYDGLAPSDGSDGQVLSTDGTNTLWDTVSSGITKTERAETFEESYISISGHSGVIDGSIDTNYGYDISTASFSQSFDISGQDINSQGMSWNNDGTKMYMIGESNINIYSYTLTTAYDISTASFSQSFDISGQDINSQGMSWNNDGTKMYMIGESNINIYSYTLTTAYDISTASFSQSFDISGESTSPTGMSWNNDGTKMYMIGYQNNNVYSYTLTTAYDISTASFSQSFNIGGEDGFSHGMSWNSNGTKMYIVGNNNDRIYEYNVEPISLPAESTVSFDSPTDIYSWDIATLQTTPDGGSVTVDISDGTTTIADINRNTDISSLNSSSNIEFIVTFDGTTGTNFPKLDFLARRYEQ